MSFYQQRGDDLQLQLLVQPKASKNEVCGLQEGRLKLRITAPPVDGKANAYLQRYLAELFGIPKSRVSITAGETGRRKTALLTGVHSLPAGLSQLNADNA